MIKKMLMILMVGISFSISIAQETEKSLTKEEKKIRLEKVKCYKELSRYLRAIWNMDKEKYYSYQIILPLMQRDGFGCKSLLKFVKRGY